MLQPTQLLWDREERKTQILNVTLHKKLKFPAVCQKDLYRQAANSFLRCRRTRWVFQLLSGMTPNDTADRRLATDCDWLSASVVFENRESEIGEEDQKSINTHTAAVPPEQVNRVFLDEGDASLNENHWANQSHRRLLSHQIAVKYTPDKAISWWLSHWASEWGQSLLKVRP